MTDCRLHFEVGGNRQAVLSSCFVLPAPPSHAAAVADAEAATVVHHQFVSSEKSSDDKMTQPKRKEAR